MSTLGGVCGHPGPWQGRRKDSPAVPVPGAPCAAWHQPCIPEQMWDLCLGICSCSQRNQGHGCCSACPGDFLLAGLCWAGGWNWAAAGDALLVLGCPGVLLVTRQPQKPWEERGLLHGRAGRGGGLGRTPCLGKCGWDNLQQCHQNRIPVSGLCGVMTEADPVGSLGHRVPAVPVVTQGW